MVKVNSGVRRRVRVKRAMACAALIAALLVAGGCDELTNRFNNRPTTMSEVPASGLAYRLEADFPADRIPPALRADEASVERLPTIQKDFDERRTDDALIRTVISPDGQRALALYLAGDTPEGDFRFDIYSTDGTFLANVLPANLTGAFPSTPAWSLDGQAIAFIGYESQSAQASRERGETEENLPPADAANPSATVMPMIPPAIAFQTEQIYVANRDGRNLRPVTTRDGLVYFDFAWSPDGRFLAALASTEAEFKAALDEGLPPRGRPRIVALEGGERLLDDRLTNVVPAWSPDGTKVATAYDTDVVIYDVVDDAPTVAALPLRDALLAASRQYAAAQTAADNSASGTANNANQNRNANQLAANQTPAASATDANNTDATPLSFNPIVRLEWVEPDGILAQTAFLRIYRNTPPIKRYERWHVLHLSPQAQLLSRTTATPPTSALAACFAANL